MTALTTAEKAVVSWIQDLYRLKWAVVAALRELWNDRAQQGCPDRHDRQWW